MLATHAVQYLPHVDRIAVLGEGRVTHVGTLAELQALGLFPDLDDRAEFSPPGTKTAAPSSACSPTGKVTGVAAPMNGQPMRTETDAPLRRVTVDETRERGDVALDRYRQYARAMTWPFTLTWLTVAPLPRR